MTRLAYRWEGCAHNPVMRGIEQATRKSRRPAVPSVNRLFVAGMEPERPVFVPGPAWVDLRVVVIAFLSVALAACAELRSPRTDSTPISDEPNTVAELAFAPEPEPGIAYEVMITGVPEADLLELLQGSSQLFALKDRPPLSLSALERRARGDMERLQTALRSEGFYAGEVQYEIDRGTAPVTVTVEVSTGVQYLLAAYDVQYQASPPPPEDVQPSLDDLGLHLGMPAKAPAILAAERALAETLASRGYPLAKVLDRKTLVDHGTTTMTVSLAVDAGPSARFGAVTIEGASAVEEDYVRKLIGWTEGERYDRTKVEVTRRALSNTGLFESVSIASGTKVGPDNKLPMTLKLVEAKHRSIGFGASYSTSEGLGGEVFWEHRNLFARNERLRLTLTAAQIEQVLEADFRKPAFLRRDQDLLANFAVSRRDTEAFEEKSIIGSVGLERPWRENWRMSAGVSGEYSILEDELGEETFRLLGLPLTAARDATDSLLNPTRGTRLNLGLTPYAGKGDDNQLFTVATVTGSAYHAVDRDERFVLAGRAKTGTIVGEETESVPANKRFYAGGGGSIRGFEFQSVGPLDNEGDPLGGRSILELNAELRIRVAERVGIVPFVDGGTVFDSSYPDFDGTFRWAAGLGGRYYSDIGPLRVDIAVPLNRRDIDDTFQFYISLGQAF